VLGCASIAPGEHRVAGGKDAGRLGVRDPLELCFGDGAHRGDPIVTGHVYGFSACAEIQTASGLMRSR
jgi:hypothetical protein